MSASSQTFQPPKSWELSLYELHRTPQEAITDDTEIALSPRSLHSELMCPICLDMLTNTMTTKECLHRFCHDCIITALRAGNKECPTCRKKLISKRSLRRDPNFDSLIEKIYPDRDEYEAQQEKVLEKLNQHTNQQALTNSIEEGLRIQAQNRLQRMLKQQRKAAEAAQNNNDDDQPSAESTPQTPEPPTQMGDDSSMDSQPSSSQKSQKRKKDNSGQSASVTDNDTNGQIEPEDIELIFHPHPEYLDKMQHRESRYLKTTIIAKINHLRRFFSIRLALERGQTLDADQPDRSYNIYITNPNKDFIELDPEVALGEVQTKYWKENKPLELFYAEILKVETDDAPTADEVKIENPDNPEAETSNESETVVNNAEPVTLNLPSSE